MKTISLRTFFGGRSPWEIALLLAASIAALFSLISISAIEAAWTLALLAWIALFLSKKRRVAIPGFFWPLLVYAGWSLLAAAMSADPAASFSDARDLLLILVIPLAAAAFEKREDHKLASAALFLSGLAASGWAIFIFLTRSAPGQRIEGFMDHYMTQAGLLALFIAFGLALAVFGRGKARLAWAAVLVPAFAALLMTLTRNAWLGVAAGACLLLFLWKPPALLLVPVLAGLLLVAGPPALKSRMLSIFDLRDPSNIARLEYARAGIRIVGERPLFGTGPDTVETVFQDPRFGLGDYARGNVHLHNNILQIAAERGLPALLAWLAFLGWAFISLTRAFRAPGNPGKALAAGGLAALVVLFVGGLFEYNFGDSEVALLFFLILGLASMGSEKRQES